MSWALADQDNLAVFVGQQGGPASKLLHDGQNTAKTREIEAELTIRSDSGENKYAFRLFFRGMATR